MSMNRSDLSCFFPVEIKNRDLDGRLLLAAEIASRGIDSVIGSKNAVSGIIDRYKYPAIFDKGLIHEPEPYAEFKRHGGSVFNLNEEAGVYTKENLEPFILPAYQESVVPYVDMFFEWGATQAEFLLEKRPSINPADMIAAGNPKFDLLSRKFRAFYKPQVSAIKEKYGDFILVNTNFAAANNFLEDVTEQYSYNACLNEDGAKAAHLFYKKGLDAHVAAIKKCSTMLPDTNIVVRPHPAEKVEYYQRAFAGLRNVHVVYEGNVYYWILAARLMIHHDCSTGVEAFLAETPTFAYVPNELDQAAQRLPVDVSHEFREEDELLGAIGSYIKDGISPDSADDRAKKRELCEKWIANTDTTSVDIIADAFFARRAALLEQAIRNRENNSDIISSGRHDENFMKHTVRRLQNKKYLSRIRKDFRVRNRLQRKKMPGISAEDIRDRLNQLCAIDDKFGSVNVVALSKNGYLLSVHSRRYKSSETKVVRAGSRDSIPKSAHTCFFPMEIKNRDFDGRLLAAAEMSLAGIPGFIGSKQAVSDSISDYEHPIFFEKGMGWDPEPYVQMKNRGASIVSIHEEGGIFTESNLEQLYFPGHKEAVVPLADFHFQWGKIQSDFLREKCPYIDPENLVIVGNPRFDLLKKEFHGYYQKEVDQLRRKYGRFILVTTQFAAANYYLADIEGQLRYQILFNEEQSKRTYEYNKKALDAFIDAIKTMAKRLKGINIVVRPHPAENDDLYERAFADYENVLPVYEGGVHKWIIAAEGLIHHNCTTGIESFVAGKPTIAYNPVSLDPSAQRLPVELSDVANSKEELMALIDSHFMGVGTPPTGKRGERSELLRQWIANIDYSSAERIAEVLSKNAPAMKDNAGCWVNEYKRMEPYDIDPSDVGVRRFIRRSKNLVWRASKEARRRRQVRTKKMPGLSDAEVQNSLSALKNVNSKYGSLRARKICRDGFLIYDER